MKDMFYKVRNRVGELSEYILRRGPDWDVKASPGDCYMVDTSKNKVVIGLPDSAKCGDTFSWVDAKLSFGLHPLVIHRNGHRIMGVEDHLCCNRNGDNGMLYYVNQSIGWRLL